MVATGPPGMQQQQQQHYSQQQQQHHQQQQQQPSYPHSYQHPQGYPTSDPMTMYTLSQILSLPRVPSLMAPPVVALIPSPTTTTTTTTSSSSSSSDPVSALHLLHPRHLDWLPCLSIDIETYSMAAQGPIAPVPPHRFMFQPIASSSSSSAPSASSSNATATAASSMSSPSSAFYGASTAAK
jgi:hypothetical protein